MRPAVILRYRAVLERTDANWSVFFPELPSLLAAGPDREEALADARRRLDDHLCTLVAEKRELPGPRDLDDHLPQWIRTDRRYELVVIEAQLDLDVGARVVITRAGVHPGAHVSADLELPPHVEIRERAEVYARSIGDCCLVDEGAYIGAGATLDYRVMIGRQARVGAFTHLGGCVSVGDDALVAEHVYCGNWVTVMNGARVWFGAILLDGASIGSEAVVGEQAIVGQRARICARATVGPRARIGDDAFVEPGAVVRADAIVRPGHVVRAG